MEELALSVDELEAMLSRTPVIAKVHPLVPTALSETVRIVSDANAFQIELDEHAPAPELPTLLLSSNAALDARFPRVTSLGLPPIERINAQMHQHLSYLRSHLVTTRTIADQIEADVVANDWRIVVLLLIDGLSFEDVLDWDLVAQPCFVDGPSVTFRLGDDPKHANPDVGFSAIVGSPTLFWRLMGRGFRNAYGFTYWEPESNIISDHIFAQIPTRSVANFEAILSELSNLSFEQPTYLQIMRQGLDGLAHSKRELARSEISGALSAIRNDIDRLAAVLNHRGNSACIYVVADHGILWKTEHQWVQLSLKGSKPRFSESRPDQLHDEHYSRFECGSVPFYVLHHPYLGAKIPSNDSGVHGGLSYQESIVPLLRIGAKPS